MTNATVLLSGGLVSAACMYFLKEQNMEVDGLFVDFGQAASKCEAVAAPL